MKTKRIPKRNKQPSTTSRAPGTTTASKIARARHLSFTTGPHAVSSVKQGYKFSTFSALSHSLAVPHGTLARVTGISATTLHRREQQGNLGIKESERVYLLGSLFELAVKVLGSTASARDWFKTPQGALDNETPLEHSTTLPGADEVRDLLMAMEYGVYV